MMRYRAVERVVKGYANHRRLQIMEYLYLHPEADLNELALKLRVNYKTLNEHMRRLALVGLVAKRHEAVIVRHPLTERGETVLNFLRNWDK